MNRGYIRTWRKVLDSGWLKNHKLWAFWSYCLLKASYREYDAIVGLQVVHLLPGQFVFGLKKATLETGLSIQEIRTIIAFLIKAGNLTIKSTNKFSIITIMNWGMYQSDDSDHNNQSNKPLTNEQQHTNIKTLKNKKPPVDFSEIPSLEERYSDIELINQCFDTISSTRKLNRISDSVKLNILHQWEKYPVDQVMAGIRIYLEKDYAQQGKNEKYLLGIIRGNSKQPPATIPGGKVIKRTGSLLDKVYQDQGFTLI